MPDTPDRARRLHFGEFYGLLPLPPGPLALVHGNCQAESLRVLLGGSATFPARPVRIPPVHELERSDLPHLDTLLTRTAFLFSQPVRDDYRGLPLGTGELATRAPRARVVRWPVIRHPALHPWSAIVRHPRDPAVVPPVVPYHDLRVLAEAAGLAVDHEPGPAALREVGERGIAELARREARDADVGVSDLLTGLGAVAAHTLNHPGNPVLVALARRLQAAVGAPADAADPGRELLGGIRAPLDAAVVAAWGLDAEPRPDWEVHGEPVSHRTLRAAHLRWYADHPEWLAAGLTRHGDALRILGVQDSSRGDRVARKMIGASGSAAARSITRPAADPTPRVSSVCPTAEGDPHP
ncbi:WcbI family polysaccharide biosynthesis putative acetyltransferase [Pseudonocardia xishanensis]